MTKHYYYVLEIISWNQKWGLAKSFSGIHKIVCSVPPWNIRNNILSGFYAIFHMRSTLHDALIYWLYIINGRSYQAYTAYFSLFIRPLSNKTELNVRDKKDVVFIRCSTSACVPATWARRGYTLLPHPPTHKVCTLLTKLANSSIFFYQCVCSRYLGLT